MLLNLMLELAEIGKRGEGVVICLPQKLHASSLSQLAETLQHIRGVSLELLQSGSGDENATLKSPPCCLMRSSRRLFIGI